MLVISRISTANLSHICGFYTIFVNTKFNTPNEIIFPMKDIVFATNNAHKLKELREIAAGKLNVLSLSDIGCHDDIPETASTIEGNAKIKADNIKQHYGYDCFADDTGLEVSALNGAPGVYSARYAGNDCNSEHNIDLLLHNLEGVDISIMAIIASISSTLSTSGRWRPMRGAGTNSEGLRSIYPSICK